MINLDEAQRYIAQGAVLIDVRDEDEYLTHHLKGAINIPLYTFSSAITKYSKDSYIIVYCKTGKRSYTACQILKSAGYRNVFNLDVKL